MPEDKSQPSKLKLRDTVISLIHRKAEKAGPPMLSGKLEISGQHWQRQRRKNEKWPKEV